jgi:hypothetical protein
MIRMIKTAAAQRAKRRGRDLVKERSATRKIHNRQSPAHKRVLCLKCSLKLERKVCGRYPSALSIIRKMQVYKAVVEAPMVMTGIQKRIYIRFKKQSFPILLVINNSFEVKFSIPFPRK